MTILPSGLIHIIGGYVVNLVLGLTSEWRFELASLNNIPTFDAVTEAWTSKVAIWCNTAPWNLGSATLVKLICRPFSSCLCVH
jgi:hypothetical protein